MEITDTRDRKEYRFSVFTATYNRGNMLKNVYDDLLNQTYQDFEWVIVNDGSSDNTDEVVREFIEEKKLPILYIKRKMEVSILLGVLLLRSSKDYMRLEQMMMIVLRMICLRYLTGNGKCWKVGGRSYMIPSGR